MSTINQLPEEKKSIDLWKEIIDPVTGKSSLTQNIIPKVVKEWCYPGEHFFVWEMGSSREAICNKCQYSTAFIPGLHELKNGKITTRV